MLDTGAVFSRTNLLCRVKMIVLAESPEQVRELMEQLLLEQKEQLEQLEAEQLVWTYIQSPATLSDMAEFIPDTRSIIHSINKK
jgi:hypothetical protein